MEFTKRGKDTAVVNRRKNTLVQNMRNDTEARKGGKVTVVRKRR